MSIMEMLCMQPVYVGPKIVKDTCLSKISIVFGGSTVYHYNILTAKLVDPRVASSEASLQSVGPQRLSTQHSVPNHL